MFKENNAQPEPFVDENEEEQEEDTEPTHEDKVEDISIQAKKPFLDDDDLPPFLRKLKK